VTDHEPHQARRLSLGRRLAIMAASGLATLALALMIFGLWGLWVFSAPGPSGHPTMVVLRHGASLPEIAAQLEDQQVVRSASVFVAAAQISGTARRLKAGEYDFKAHASIADVLGDIRQGRIVRHFVTVPEGRTSQQAVDILMANPVLTGSVAAPPEGALLPETYEVQRGEDRAAVMQRMINARDKLLAQLWPKRRPGLPFKTVDEAMTMASIVEKETSVAAERPHVAAVYINRLRKGMRLEADPTIVYGLTRGVPLGHGIRQSELYTVTPYNTYLVSGLPPTPICNPGRAAIAATLDPIASDDLFFVATGNGGHVFSSTYEQHAKNVAQWRGVEHQRAAALAGAPATGTPASDTPATN
jgi:UPF0755 protein